MTTPIIYPISATDQVPVSVVVSVLLSLLFIGVSMLVCLLMTHIMQKQDFHTHPPLQMILTGCFALALYLRFGCSMVAVQGMILFFILLYASCSDLTTHTMDDYLWVMVGILGLLSVSRRIEPTTSQGHQIQSRFSYRRQPVQNALSCYDGHYEKMDGKAAGLGDDTRATVDLLCRQDARLAQIVPVVKGRDERLRRP